MLPVEERFVEEDTEDEKENEDDENDREYGNNQTGNDRCPALSVQIRLGFRIESGVNAHGEKGLFPVRRRL